MIKKILLILLMVGLFGCSSTFENKDNNKNQEFQDVYASIGTDSGIIDSVSIEDINEIIFIDTFEVIENELHGWYSAKTINGKVIYFHKFLNDEELPIYSGIEKQLDIENIKLITKENIIEIKVGEEASSVNVENTFSEFGYFAIVDRYEEAKWTIINSKTGELYNFTGEVLLSPDGSFFVVSNPYGQFEGSSNSIAIYSINTDNIKDEWIAKGIDWSPENVQWKSDILFSYSEVYYTGILMTVEKSIDKVVRYDGSKWITETKSE